MESEKLLLSPFLFCMQVVLLAGGQGTRLGSLTDSIPKPMMDIEGKPFLELLITYLVQQNFHDFLVIVGYLPDYIPSRLGDGSQLSCSLRYTGDEGNLRVGTGGALKNAEADLDDQFLLLFADTFLPLDYQVFANDFRSRSKLGLLAVYDNAEDTDVTGNIELADDGRVERYLKGHHAGLTYVDSGALCLSRDVLSLIDAESSVSLEEDVYPQLIEKGELYAHQTSKRFYDIGTPSRLQLFKQCYHDYF